MVGFLGGSQDVGSRQDRGALSLESEGCNVGLLLLLLLHACAAVVVAAAQAVAAVIRASPKRRRFSGHTFSNAILHWYGSCGEMPRGISVNCASVRDWSLRNGVALRKLVAILNMDTWVFY